MSNCELFLLGRRGPELHALLTRLLGRCTCESLAEVIELYTVDGSVRECDRQSA